MMKEAGRSILTDACNASVVIFPKLNCQLNDDPDSDGDEAHSSNVGHDLQAIFRLSKAGGTPCKTSLCQTPLHFLSAEDTATPPLCWIHLFSLEVWPSPSDLLS